MGKDSAELNGSNGDEMQDTQEFLAFFEELKNQYPTCSKTEAKAMFKIEKKKTKLKERERRVQSKIEKKHHNKMIKVLIKLGREIELAGSISPAECKFDLSKGLLAVSRQVRIAIYANAQAMLYAAAPPELAALQELGEKIEQNGEQL